LTLNKPFVRDDDEGTKEAILKYEPALLGLSNASIKDLLRS
jgi:hypothetical protein